MTQRLPLNWSRFLGVPQAALLLLVWGAFTWFSYATDDAQPRAVYTVVGFCGMVALAAHRAHRRNPASNARYGQWLRRTPWRWGRPLPLGPSRLCVADAVLLVLFAVTFPLGFVPGLVGGAIGFSAGYVASVADSALRHDDRILPLGAAVLLGLGIAFSVGPEGPSPTSLFVAALGMLLVSQFSLASQLHRFDELELREPSVAAKKSAQPRRRGDVSGPPWRQLLEGIDPSRPVRLPLLTPLLLLVWFVSCFQVAHHRLGVWAAGADAEALQSDFSPWGGFRWICYTAMTPEEHQISHLDATGDAMSGASVTLWAVLLMIVAFGAIAPHVSGHWPPMNPLGRIATGQLIIPGYDYVFLGPLVSLVTYGVVAGLLAATTDLGLLTGAIAFAAALVPLVKLTPSMESWRLTGHHRIIC